MAKVERILKEIKGMNIKGKAANHIQRNSYKAISLFFSRHSAGQMGVELYI